MAEIKNRDGHENAFARKLGSLSAKHRRELQSHLGSPPDAANVPAEFWRRVEQETQEDLAAVLLLLFVLSASEHGLGRDRSSGLGAQYAGARSRQVAGQWTTNGRQRIEQASIDWRARAGRGSPPTSGEVTATTFKIFGPSRVSRLVVSETTDAQTAGSEAGVQETVGLSEDDTWFTNFDDRVCPICAPLHRKKRSVWSLKFPKGPKAHIGCRCWVHYALEKRGARLIA